MSAITETHKLLDQPAARYWLAKNGFSAVSGQWMDKANRWARCEVMPSGKIFIKVGVV